MQQALYREVPIYGQGGVVAVALVDDADYEWAIGHRWNRMNGHGGCFYAGRQTKGRVVNGYRSTITLHRELLGLIKGDGKSVDHLNGNTLDNRRSNLDVTTHAENMRRIHTNTDSIPSMRHRIRKLEAQLAAAREALAILEAESDG